MTNSGENSMSRIKLARPGTTVADTCPANKSISKRAPPECNNIISAYESRDDMHIVAYMTMLRVMQSAAGTRCDMASW